MIYIILLSTLVSTNNDVMRNKKTVRFIFALSLSFALIACSAAKKSEQDIVDELNNRMHQIDEQLLKEKVFSPLHVSKSAKEALKAKADSVIALVKELQEEYGYFFPERRGFEVDKSLVGAPLVARVKVDLQRRVESNRSIYNSSM